MSAARTPLRARFERRYGARIDAFDGELTCSVHVPTGARHFHLDAPLEDSAFRMAFLTPAPDSSGLTHVLEHLVMCGSERFPCRRAFFAMLGRTLCTTMNASTTEDCTSFHFATSNLADYENLLGVYVDAAFFPRLDRLDFAQEGCRVEIEGEGGGEKRPVRRGVVLSEMRGLMGEPEHELEQALNRALFPGTPYRFNAGGDPFAIPALEHETLKEYHRRHYHPANAVFLSAGRMGPEWLHHRLEELVLGRFPGREPDCVPCPDAFVTPPFKSPARSVVRYPAMGAGVRVSPGAGVALGWRLGETSDPVAAVGSRLLARCLLEHEDAPLRRALAEASGGSAPVFGSNAVQATRRRLVLRCGVLGCDPELAGEIEARALEAIDGAARNGLDRAHVRGALARIERELRERHDPRFPFALGLLDRMLPVALYGGEPAAALDLPAALAALRDEIGSPDGVAALVRSCLRDNADRALVTAVPDPAAARRLDAEDRDRLEREFGPSRPEARRRIAERSRALRRRQGSSTGESSLPRLALEEIGPARERPELRELRTDGEDGPRVWLSRGPTGGLVYARLAVDIPCFGIGQLDDVALLGAILPECGHGGLAAAGARARLLRLCDGLAAEPWMLARTAPGPQAPGAGAPRAVLVLSARALSPDEDLLLDVLADAHFSARFDRGARAALATERARRRRDLTRNGHLHAERIAAARIDPWAAVAERWHGPSALAILEDGDEGEPLAERLHYIHRVLAAAPYRLQIVRDRDDRSNAGSNRAPFEPAPPNRVTALTAEPRTPGTPPEAAPEGHELPPSARAAPCHASVTGAWIADGPVNYCARVHPAVAADHPDAGPLAVLAAFLGGDLLQRAVRERGGAYGAGARYCRRTCTVRMFSYRDPRLAQTLADFDRALETLGRSPPRGQRLEEAILRTVREIDKPKAFQVDALERFLDELQDPGSRGALALRASVLGAEPEQLRDVAERYLSPEQGCAGVLAGTGREAELDRLALPWRRL